MSTQSHADREHADRASPSRADTKDGASPAETRQLIGLLENLVPLLLHFQSQTPQPYGAVAFAGPRGAEIEQQAAVAFTEDVILDSLRNLTSYLKDNARSYPGLETYTSVVDRARQALGERNYQAALALILDAYRAVAVVRAIRPELPPIRARSSNEPEAQARSVH